jgi:hypothetical protein
MQTGLYDVRAVMDAVGSERAALLGFLEGGSAKAAQHAAHASAAAAPTSGIDPDQAISFGQSGKSEYWRSLCPPGSRGTRWSGTNRSPRGVKSGQMPS